MKGTVWNQADVRVWIACAMCFVAGFLMREVRVEAAVREPVQACAERPAPVVQVTPAVAEVPTAIEKPTVEPSVARAPQSKPTVPATKADRVAPSKAPVAEFKRVRSAIAATPMQPIRASTDKASARDALAANDSAKALRILTRNVPKLAADPEHLSLLAVSLVGVGRFQEAGVIYRALIEHDAHDTRAIAGLKLCEQRLVRPPPTTS